MLQNDASQTGSTPEARNDLDVLSQCELGPATGNTITGAGTVSGAAGADTASGAAMVVAVNGVESSGGTIQVEGTYGTLVMQSDGSYTYTRKPGAPDGVSDVFTYTLADAGGARDDATLTIDIRCEEDEPQDQQTMVTTQDGVVMLPAGVELSDIRVVGRDLVITLPDGSTMTIPNGAVFVPQIVIGDVEVPPTNLAALLIESEPQPASGTPQSSGGNFATDVPPLDPGVPLGDLIPPTEMFFPEPVFEEVGDIVDREPEIFVQPEGQPAQVAAVDAVEEAGLPERNEGEPAGSGESADGNGADNDVTSETTTGTIIIDSPDEPNVVTINGVAVTSVGQTIAGEFGTLTITSISDSAIGYSYTLDDNTSGNDTHDDFSVTVTDNNDDTATATLRINIVDDVPTAVDDTDSIAAGQFGPATGNVITDAAAGDEGDSDDGADTVGADDAELTAVTGDGATTVNEAGDFVVQGEFGVLTIDSEGNYSYVRNAGTPGGVQDVFTYTLTDGDGDTDTATLTIDIGNLTVTVGQNPTVRTDDDAVPGADGNPGGVGDDVDAENLTGTLSGSGGDGELTFDLLTTGAPSGFTYVDGPNGSVLVQQVQNGATVTVLTITVDSSSGDYTVTQNAPILHPTLDGQVGDDTENNVSFTINYTVTDIDGDSAPGTLTVDVDDDTPIASEAELGGTVDEDGIVGGNAGGTEDVAGEETVVEGNVSTLFSPGADQPLTFSLLTDTDQLPALTSNGVPVTYSVEGNTLTASAGEETIFTFTVDATTGAYTFTLVGNLDHPSLDGLAGDDTENPAGTDIEIELGSIIQATDADGDSVTANADGLTITVDDDSPEPFGEDCPTAIAVNDAGSSFTGSLNLPPVGADSPGTVSFLVDDGTAVTDTEGAPISSNGQPLFYFVNDDGVLEARAGGESGDVIFTITLNGDGTFTYDQVGDITSVTTLSIVDLSSVGGGNVDARAIDVPDTQFDLILSTQPGNTVNTNATEMGVGTGQSFEAGEILRVDLIQNAFVTGSGGGAVLNFGEYYSANAYRQDVSGLAGPQRADFIVRAIVVNEAAGSSAADPADGDAVFFGDTNDTVVATTSLNLYDDNGDLVDPADYAALGITVTPAAGGGWQITGLPNDYDFEIVSNTAFNAVQVEAIDGTDTFKLGFIDITSTVQTDVDFNVPIGLTDSDGDTVVCDIEVSLGAPLDTPDAAVTVDEAALAIGSDPSSTAETQSGDLSGQISGGTPPFEFALVGSGDGAFGTLVLNEDGTFTYTLDTPFDSTPDANDGTNVEAEAEVFEFQVTDGDGTVRTGTITVNIIDDVPSVDVTVGEEAGVVMQTDDAQTIGDASDSASSAVDFSDVFNLTFVEGADGAADPALSYTLDVTGFAGGPAGVDSGLNQGGNNIYLYEIGGKVVGSTSATLGGVAEGNTVFDVSVSATGIVTLTQYSQIDHPIADDPTATEAPFADDIIELTDNLVTLTASSTITDNDGDVDSDSETVNIGANLRFTDDGPVATLDANSVTEGGQTSGNVLTNDNFGADGMGGIQGVAAGTGTTPVTGGVGVPIVTSLGTLTLNANGSYTYVSNDDSVTTTQVDHFVYTIVDADGDTSTVALDITINPVNLTADNQTQTVNEAALDTTITGDDVDAGSVTGSQPGLTTETVTGQLDVEGAAPNGYVAQNVTTAFGTFVLNTDGSYTYTLIAPVDSDPATNDGTNTELGVEVFNYTVEDTNGNSVNGTVTINVIDDVPSVDVTEGDDSLVLLETQDADTIGTDTDDDVTSADFSDVFNLTFVEGADGAADPALSYTLDVTGYTGPAGVDSGLNQGGNNIYLYEIGGKVVGSTSATLGGVLLSNTVFDVAVSGTGVVTLTQYSQVDHPTEGTTTSPFDDQFVDILDSLVTLTASSTITDNDGDIDSDSETVNIGANLRFYDDGPDISAAATTTQIRIDETDNVVAAGGETDSPGGNLGTVTMAAASLYTVTNVHESADTPTTLSYALTLSSQGVLSGLLLSSTDTAIRLWNIGGTVYGSTSTTEAGVDTVGLTNVAFTVTINGSGDVTLTQYLGIEHPDTGSHDEDSTPMASGLINVEVTATDFDNDTDAATVDIGSRIVFEDDGPRFGTVDAEININNDATPSSLNNDLQIIIGSDSPNPGNNDVTINDADLTVSVNGTPLDPSDVTITEQSETATTVIYRFSFTYANSPTTETTTFGTLTIHKDTGKYDVVLDAPISGFNIVQTSTEGNTFTGYVPGTSTVDGSQPEVSVTSIVQEAGGDPILFVQFTGDKEPSGGGDHVSVDYDLAAGPDDGDPTTFSEGELVVNDPSWVSTSGSSNGVAGDTIQADEILDFNLYTENPEGNLGMTPTGSATAMFLKFDGIGEAEDLIVILKLMDPDTGEFTTRAVYISNDDIVQGPGTGPGSYAGITLDNNDGLVIIESNDYNGAGENYVIVGAQIMNSEHGLDGEAVDLNSDINVDLNADGDFNDAGESGASDVGSTVPFSSDVDDNAPLKISSIGFVTGGSTDQEAELNFDITIQDADGDTAQQTITVNVGDFPTASEAISTKSTAAVSDSLSTDKSSASVSELISNDNSLTSLDQQMRSMNAANNNAVFLGAIAAAGIGATPAAANHAAFATADFSVGADFMAQSIEPMAASLTVDQPAESMLVAKSATAVQDAAVESAGSSQSASAGSAGDLAGGEAGASAAPVELPGGIDAPVQISAAEIAPAAMTVAMPAAETLVGAKDAGHAVQDAASTGEVARVLADALAGGGNGPSLDAMLDAATGHDAVGSADMLVANWAAAVSHWDMGAFGGFTASHSAVTMDVMTIHPDAGPLTAA